MHVVGHENVTPHADAMFVAGSPGKVQERVVQSRVCQNRTPPAGTKGNEVKRPPVLKRSDARRSAGKGVWLGHAGEIGGPPASATANLEHRPCRPGSGAA